MYPVTYREIPNSALAGRPRLQQARSPGSIDPSGVSAAPRGRSAGSPAAHPPAARRHRPGAGRDQLVRSCGPGRVATPIGCPAVHRCKAAAVEASARQPPSCSQARCLPRPLSAAHSRRAAPCAPARPAVCAWRDGQGRDRKHHAVHRTTSGRAGEGEVTPATRTPPDARGQARSRRVLAAVQTCRRPRATWRSWS